MKIQQLLNKYAHMADTRDILLLVEHILGINYSQLLAMDTISLSQDQQCYLYTCLTRLSKGEPIQYILGTWDFLDITLSVDSRALIPRAETEELALLAVEHVKTIPNPLVIDIGCGTGCIGLYIKKCIPSADVTLLDVSKHAISLANANAKNLSLDVNTICDDMRNIDSRYHVIVSNPPYIRRDILQVLDTSVTDYEPLNALDGGTDGLDYYRVLATMHTHLHDGGYLLLEIGYDQGEEVASLLGAHFTDIHVIQDIAKLDRIIIARKK